MEMFRQFLTIALRSALLLLWLIIAGISANETPPVALILVPTLFVSFLFIHAYLGLPTKVDYSRIRRFHLRGTLRFGVPIAVFLFLGDVFWILARQQLNVSADPDPLAMIVALVLLFPLIEEFGFRLWLQSPLETQLGKIGAIGVVAGAFAVVHAAEFPLPQFLSGVAYGVALVVTGSIWSAVGLHALKNGLVAILENIPGIESWALATQGLPWTPYVAGSSWLIAAALTGVWYFSIIHAPLSQRKDHDKLD